MMSFLKRIFVYFLIINYLHLNLGPTFALAMEEEKFHLNKFQPISPLPLLSQESQKNVTFVDFKPENFRPAKGYTQFSTVKIGLKKRKDNSYDFTLEKDKKTIESFNLKSTFRDVLFNFGTIEINTPLNEGMSGIKVKGLNNACNYIFDIDGRLQLEENFYTQGYLQVQKANQFYAPKFLQAESGIVIEKAKEFINHKQKSTLSSTYGAISIKSGYHQKEFKIQSKLNAKGGIYLGSKTGGLTLEGTLNSGAAISLETSKDLFLRSDLTGIGGIKVQALTGAITLGSEGFKPTLQTDGSLEFKCRQDLALQGGKLHAYQNMALTSLAGDLRVGADGNLLDLKANQETTLIGQTIGLYHTSIMGLKALTLTASKRLHLGSTQSTPDLQSNQLIHLTGGEQVTVSAGLLTSGGNITLDKSQAIIVNKGGAKTKFLAHKKINLKGDWINLLDGELTAAEKIEVEATKGEIYVGEQLGQPKLKTGGDITLTSLQEMSLRRGSFSALGNISVLSKRDKVSVGDQYSGPRLAANQQLRLVGKDVDVHNGFYQGLKEIKVEAKGGELQVGSSTLPLLLNSRGLIDLNGTQKIEVKNGLFTSESDISLTSANDIIVGSMGMTPTMTAAGNLIFNGKKVDLERANLTGRHGIRITAMEEIGVGQYGGEISCTTSRDICFIGQNKVILKNGVFKAGRSVTIDSPHAILSLGNDLYASTFIADQINLIGKTINLDNATLTGLSSITASAADQLHVGTAKTAPTLKSNKQITLTGKGEVSVKNGAFEAGDTITVESQNQGLTIGGTGAAKATFTTATTLNFIANKITFLNAELTGLKGITADAKGGLLTVGSKTEFSQFSTEQTLTLKGTGVKLLQGHLEGREGVTVNAKAGKLQLGDKTKAEMISAHSHKTVTLMGESLEFINAKMEGVGGIKVMGGQGGILFGQDKSSPLTHLFFTTKGEMEMGAQGEIVLRQGFFKAGEAIKLESTLGDICLGNEFSAPHLIADQINLLGQNINLNDANLMGLSKITASAADQLHVGTAKTAPTLKSNKQIILTGKGEVSVKNGTVEAGDTITVESQNQGLTIGGKGAVKATFTTATTLKIIANKISFLNAELTGLAGITADAKGGLLTVGSESEFSKFSTEQNLNLKGTGVKLLQGHLEGREGVIVDAKSGKLQGGRYSNAQMISAHSHKTVSLSGNSIEILNAKIEGIGGIKVLGGQGTTYVGMPGGNSRLLNSLKVAFTTQGDIEVKSQGAISIRKGLLKAAGAINVESTQNSIKLGNESSAPCLIADQINLTAQTIHLDNAKLTGFKGITATAANQLNLGTAKTAPILVSGALITLTGKQKTAVINGVFLSGGDITLNESLEIVIGEAGLTPRFAADKKLHLSADKLTLQKGIFNGLEGIEITAIKQELNVGTATCAPTFKSNRQITLTGKGDVTVKNGTFEAGGAITVKSQDQGLTIGGTGSAKATFTTAATLAFIANKITFLNAHLTGLAGITAEAKDGLLKVGSEATSSKFSTNQTLNLKGTGVKLLQGHLEGLGGIIIDSQDGELQIGDSKEISSITVCTPKALHLRGAQIDIVNGDLKGLEGVKIEAAQGPIMVGRSQRKLNLHSNGTIDFSGPGNISLAGTITAGGGTTIMATDESNSLIPLKEFTNKAILNADFITVSGFDKILNQGGIFGERYYDIAFKQQFINQLFIKGGTGTITSSDGEIINSGEIHHATINVKNLHNEATGFINQAQLTVLEGKNEGIIKADEVTVNGTPGFQNNGEMALKTLQGMGHFHNSRSLEFIQKDQTANRINIDSFLNQGDAQLNQIAILTGSSIQVAPNVHSFILGKNGQMITQDFDLNGAEGVYKNEGELQTQLLTLSQTASPFINYHFANIDHLLIKQGATVQNNGELQIEEMSGKGAFSNHNLLTLFPTKVGHSTIGVEYFINESENIDSPATIHGQNVILQADAREFIVHSGLMNVDSLLIEESPHQQRTLRNAGKIEAAQFTLNENTFSNDGQMTVDLFEGTTGTFINQGTLDSLGKAEFCHFINHGTADIDGLKVGERGENTGELTLKFIAGKGGFYNHGQLFFLKVDGEDAPAAIQVNKFINQSKTESNTPAEVRGGTIVVAEEVAALTFGPGKVIAQSLILEGGAGVYENRGDLTADTLTLNHLQNPFINHHLITVETLEIQKTSQFLNHGNLQVKTLLGTGYFYNHNLLNLIGEEPEEVDRATIRIAHFINDSKTAEVVATVLGHQIDVSQTVEEFILRTGLMAAQNLIFAAKEGAEKFYENQGDLRLQDIDLNHNTLLNSGQMIAARVGGEAGIFINHGGFFTTGQTSFDNFTNQGIAQLEALTINGQAKNTGSVLLHSLNGKGHFLNQGNLEFLGSLENQSVLGIRQFTNQNEDNSEQPAKVEGGEIIVSATVEELNLKSGVVVADGLLFDGGNGQYSNYGEVAAQTLTLNHLQTAFINHNLITVNLLEIQSTSHFINQGDLQVGFLKGSGTFTNYNLVKLYTQNPEGIAILGIAHFSSQNQELKSHAQVLAKEMNISAEVENFIIQSGLMEVGSLSIDDPLHSTRFLRNYGKLTADSFILNQNTFENFGHMGVEEFKGTRGNFINHKTLNSLHKATFDQFENRGEADLDGLNIAQKGTNKGTLTLKTLQGRGAFSNHKNLIFVTASDAVGAIEVNSFTNKSEDEHQAQVRGGQVVVSPDVTEFLLGDGKFNVQSLTLECGHGIYENRGELTAVQLFLENLYNPLINYHHVTVDQLKINSTSHLINHGDLQAGSIIGNGSFVNHNLLRLMGQGEYVEQGTLGIETFINETNGTELAAKVIGKKIIFSQELRKFELRSGLLKANTLTLEKGTPLLKNYTNSGEIQTDVLVLNQNTFKNNNLFIATEIEGLAGDLINNGTFGTKGQAAFNTLQNNGTTFFEELVINEKATNKGTLNLNSLAGTGHFYNHGELLFAHIPNQESKLAITQFTNESVTDLSKGAKIKGADVVISTLLTLKQGKVRVKNLTFSGTAAYKNDGKIKAETLILAHLAHSFVNAHLMTVNEVRIHSEKGFVNHGDLQTTLLSGTGFFKNHNVLNLVAEGDNSVSIDVPEFINETTDKQTPAQIFGKKGVISSHVTKFLIHSGSMDFKTLELEANNENNQNFVNHGTLNTESLILNQQAFNNHSTLKVTTIKGLAGSIINHGTFSATGQTPLVNFENHGTANLEHLAISGKGQNKNILTLHSLKGTGSFYNSRHLTFQPEEGVIGIATFTNASEKEAKKGAEIHGGQITISEGITALTLGHGKVSVKNLTLNGKKTAYENKGEITAETLTISQLQSSLTNYQVITTDNLTLSAGNSFINKGDLQVGTVTGSGSLLNHLLLTFKSKNKMPAVIDVVSFISKSEAKSAPKVYANHLNFAPQLKEFIIASGFLQAESLTLQEKKGVTPLYQNQAEIRAGELVLNHHGFTNSANLLIESISGTGANLINHSSGLIKSHYGTLDQFTNNGTALINILTVQGKAVNANRLHLKILKGPGTFHNQARLKFTGTSKAPSSIGVQTFINASGSKTVAEITATDLMVMTETKNFTLSSGIAEIDHLIIQSGAGALTCTNAGELIASSLRMGQSSFKNEGHLTTKILAGDLQTLTNDGELIVEAQTLLPKATLTNTNEAIATFEGSAKLKGVINKGDLTAEKGLEASSWSGAGNSEIHQLFKVGTASNQGTLSLLKAAVTLTQPLVNRGTLTLTNVVFATAAEMTNYETLVVEGGLTLKKLTNHKLLQLLKGKYKIDSFDNKGKTFLCGAQWLVSTQKKEWDIADLALRTLHNSGEINVNGTLTYHLSGLPQGSWKSSGQVTYKFPGMVLKPSDLTALAGTKLVIEADSFIVPESTILSIPHLVLHLSNRFHIEKEFGTNNLEVYVKKSFTCGKALKVNGDLTLHAPSLPTQQADIHVTGNGLIRATASSIVVGGTQLETTESYQEFDWTPFGGASGRDAKRVSTDCKTLTDEMLSKINLAPYHKTISNGTSVSAGSKLTLQSPQDITVYGSVYSGGDLSLEANPQTGIINCEVGQIESLQDIHLYGHKYINKRSIISSLLNTYVYSHKRWNNDEVFGGGWYETRYYSIGTLTYHIYSDTPSVIQSGKDIHFHTTQVENLGSTIASAGSIYHQNKIIASPKLHFQGLSNPPPQALENKKYPYQGGFRHSPHLPALVLDPKDNSMGANVAKYIIKEIEKITLQEIEAVKNQKTKEENLEQAVFNRLGLMNPLVDRDYIYKYFGKEVLRLKAIHLPPPPSTVIFRNQILSQKYEFECWWCEHVAHGNPYFDTRCNQKGRTNFLAPVPSYVLAGKALALRGSHVITTGILHAKTIKIHALTFDARNVNPVPTPVVIKLRPHDRRIDNHLVIDMAEFAREEYGSRPGFIQVTSEGAIVPKYAMPYNLKLTRDNILFVAENAASFPFIMDTLLKAIDRMLQNGNRTSAAPDVFSYMDKMLHFKIDLSILHSVFQRTLTDYFNTQTIQKRSGLDALQGCFDTAKTIKEERNSSLIPYQELSKYKNIYIVFQVIEQLKKIWLKPLLVASIDNINLFNQSGDVSSSELVEIKTEGDASFTGQNVSGNEGINVSAGGTLTRKTLKKRKAFRDGDVSGTFEQLEPQQTFYSRDGFVETFGKKLNHELSTLTVARKNISRSSDHQLLLDAHTLKRESRWGDHNNGGSSTTHTFTTNQTITGGVAEFNVANSNGQTRLINPHVQATDIIFDGGTVEVTGSKAINVQDTIETHKKMFSRRTVKEHTENVVFQAANLNAKRSVQFTEKTKQARLIGTRVKARKLVNQTQKGLTVMPLVGTSIYQTEQFQGNRYVNSKVSVDQGQQMMLETILDVAEIFTQNTPLKLISAKMRESTTIDGVYETAIQHLESWNRVKQECKKIPGAVMAVVAIGLAALTAGAGAAVAGFLNTVGTLAGTMISATVNALCTMLGTTLVETGGDLEKTVMSVASKEGMISLAANIATAGVLDGMGVKAPDFKAGFEKVAVYGLWKNGVMGGMNVLLGRENIGEAVRHAGLNTVFDVAGRMGANQIGAMYKNGAGGQIGYVEHKFWHGAMGAGLGLVKGDPVAGAVAGMVAEIVTDATKEDTKIIAARVDEKALRKGILRESEDYQDLVRKEVQMTMDWGKLGAVVAVALAGKDVNVGLDVATNAVENNFVHMIILGVIAANAALTTVDVIEGVQEGGLEGGLHVLREDAALAMATGGAGKPIQSGQKFLKQAQKLLKRGEKTVGAQKIARGKEILDPALPGGAIKQTKTSHQPALTPDYSTPEAPYSLRIDPLTGKGPMHIDSRDFTSATSHTVEGAKRNKNQFWKLWAEKYPETLSKENLEIIKLGRAPEVDPLWARAFPEHQNYLGQKLIHHHIEHNHLTTALPKILHGSDPGNKMFHTNLGGGNRK